LHFITTSVNNRRQLRDNDFTTEFLLLSSFKNFYLGTTSLLWVFAGKYL